MLPYLKIRVIRAIRVVYFSPRITLISRMQLSLKIRVIRAIRIVYLSPRISLISRMQLFFKIRVIRAIRVVYFHHELLESHECSRVYNSCDSRDSCCFPSPRISRISRMLLFFKIRLIRLIRVVYFHHKYPESHECCCVFRFV